MAIEVPPHWRQWMQVNFPGLVEGVSFEFTSEVNFNYNCLSWALSINDLLFEEVCGGFWPWHHIDSDTADGWVEVCKIHGFVLQDNLDASFVPGHEKIAILTDNEGDLHACRQDQKGRWKSKLGGLGPDIDHDGLAALEHSYGIVVRVLQRERPDWNIIENA